MSKSPPLNIMLVEDEFITLETLSDTLRSLNHQVVGMAKTAEAALKILEEQEVDLAILDINIQGDKDGVYLGGVIHEKHNIPFIFLTAYGDKFTVERAIATQPYGYLLKPFNNLDVFTAIEVAMKNFAVQKGADPEDNFYSDSSEPNIDDVIFIRDNYHYVSVKISDIKFIQSGKNYIDVHTQEKKYLVRSSMKEFILLLPQTSFFQVHKSYAINKRFVTKFSASAVNLDQIEIPIGAAFRLEFQKQFKTI